MPRASRFSSRRAFFLSSIRCISRRLLRPDLSDQIHQMIASTNGTQNFQRSPKNSQFQLAERADVGEVEDDQHQADEDEQHDFLPRGAAPGGSRPVNARTASPLC